jgi:hypothetical protein
MSVLFEFRIEATVSEAEQLHLAVFATDEHGQWVFLDNWTGDDHQEVQEAKASALDMVTTWLAFSGALLPA